MPSGLPATRTAPKLVAAVLLAAALAAPAAAQPAPGAVANGRPLVYVVVIDGLGPPAVQQGHAPYLSSLIAGAHATVYRESRALMIAETNSNHAGMLTGAYTNRSGIPGNQFAVYAPLEGADPTDADHCRTAGPPDLSRLPSRTSGEDPSCLQAETVFEAIRRQGNPDGIVTAAIFGKAKLGRIFSGRRFDGRNRDVNHLWAPCTPEDPPDAREYCANVPIEPASRDRTVSDTLVMDEVIRTIREGVAVGDRRVRPDFTIVNMPNVDNAGHAFGGYTFPYEVAVSVADREIQRLVSELRTRGLWERSVLVLLSDHSHDDTPEVINLTGELHDAGIPEGSFRVVQNGNADMVYLADRVSPDRFRLLTRIRAATLAIRGVDEALYREPNALDGGAVNTIDGAHPAWRAAGERGPDVLVTARRGWRFSDPNPIGVSTSTANPLPGNHGGTHTLNNFFAVVGGGPLVSSGDLAGEVGPRFDDTLENESQAENVDVASTVMGLFGLFSTRDNAGRFLGEAFSDEQLRRTSAPPAAPSLSIRARSLSRTGRTRSHRLSWRPAGGLYDASIRGSRGWRRLQRRSAQTVRNLHLRVGRRYVVRVRSRAASGVHSPWRTRAFRVRP